jgi:endonuclease/exonuclease/phosphatase (EEP) superfamily protein YafD
VTIDKLPSPANQNSDKPKKKLRRDWSGATIGLALGVLGLIMARLGHLWVGFDVFSQFSIQFIFLALAMTLGLVSPRFKGLVGLVLFLAFVVGYALWPQLNLSAKETQLPAGSQRLRVASLNTFIYNRDYKAISNAILKLNPDVMTLVEFMHDKQELLDDLRSVYPYQETCFTQPECESAIISKYPLFNTSAKIFWAGAPLIQSSLGPEFGNLTIFGIHTTRFPHSRAQFTQIKELAKYIETVPGRVVIMGDFNATPFSRITQTLAESLGLKLLTNLPSWPATHSFPQLAIDHIFVSRDISPLSSEVIGDFAGSDHFPVAITLAVPQN